MPPSLMGIYMIRNKGRIRNRRRTRVLKYEKPNFMVMIPSISSIIEIDRIITKTL
jgi:hypothetical protein